jgi:hypothetical protein
LCQELAESAEAHQADAQLALLRVLLAQLRFAVKGEGGVQRKHRQAESQAAWLRPSQLLPQPCRLQQGVGLLCKDAGQTRASRSVAVHAMPAEQRRPVPNTTGGRHGTLRQGWWQPILGWGASQRRAQRDNMAG